MNKGLDDTVEKIFDNGGHKALYKEFGNVRNPYNYKRFMTARSALIWKRFLNWRWKKKNPEKVAQRNKYWWEHYKETKPARCVCKYCGEEFNAPRSHYKMCPVCRERPKPTELKLMAKKLRSEAKKEMRRKAFEWYNAGRTQKQIAEIFGESQRVISYWIRKEKGKNNDFCNKIKRKK